MDEFGIMVDFDVLLDEVYKCDMKFIIDLVINYMSDEYLWFIELCLFKDNLKCDWYIWYDGKDGVELNNWESIFNGLVWEYDEEIE